MGPTKNNIMKKIIFILALLFSAIALPNAVFADNYDLWIGNVRVTDENKDNITGEGISGLVSYNPATKTLTLNNATITALHEEFYNSIYAAIDSLTIEIIGTCNFLVDTNLTEYVYTFDLYDYTIITGDILNISTNGTGIFWNYCDGLIHDITMNITSDGAMYIENSNVTIENSNVTVIGNNSGILGYLPADLTIRNSTVRTTGRGESGFNAYASLITVFLELDNCEITQPVGAYYDSTITAVVDANGVVLRTEVVIEPIAPIIPIDTTDPVDPVDPVDPIDPIDPVEPGDTTGISDVDVHGVSLYPNPATEVLNVVSEGFSSYQIINFVGQVVSSGGIANGTTQINIAPLPAGNYFVRLIEEGVAVKRFAKQ